MDEFASDSLIHDPEGGVARLREIMRRLRDPETGCPWDIVQTFDAEAPGEPGKAGEVASIGIKRVRRQAPFDARALEVITDRLGDRRCLHLPMLVVFASTVNDTNDLYPHIDDRCDQVEGLPQVICTKDGKRTVTNQLVRADRRRQ